MKRKLIAIVLALGAVFSTVSPAAAYSLQTHGPFADDYAGFHYTVRVCVHSNTGSSTWNTGTYPFHARLAAAMATWNALGGEAQFIASNTCLSTDTTVTAQYGLVSGSGIGSFVTNGTSVCAETWVWCWRTATLKVDNVETTIYTGTGPQGSFPGKHDLWSILTHELGHVVLNHDNDNPTQQTMSTGLTTNTIWMRTLTTGGGSDAAGWADAYNY